MTEKEAREKYEDRIWNLLLASRQIGGRANYASHMLTRVLDDMANDGFYPRIATSAIDPGLHGMLIIEIPGEELKRVRKEYTKKYKEEPGNTEKSSSQSGRESRHSSTTAITAETTDGHTGP